MEDKDSFNFQDFEEEEDALSLCDLAMHDSGVSESHDDPSHQNSPRASTDQDLFEFFSDLSSAIRSPSQDIVFCGKIISHDHHQHKRYQVSVDGDRLPGENRSNSLTFPNSDRHQKKRIVRCESSSAPRTVNVTSITSMSAKSKRRMFMFGPVRFNPEMDLSAIKKRQSRRAPAPVSPAPCETGRGGWKKGGWRLLRTLTSGPHLPTALGRSFACISMPTVLETTA